MSIRFWIKERKLPILFWLIIFLVATTSFALGYLMNWEGERAPIVVEQCRCETGE